MRVAITGVGLVSALGRGLDQHLDRLLAGETGLGPLSAFEAPGIPPSPVGQLDLVPPSGMSRCEALALLAAADALSAARLPSDSSSAGVFALGTTTGGIFESEEFYLRRPRERSRAHRAVLLRHPAGAVLERLSQRLGLSGEPHTFSTACSSSANAIGFAASRVEAGAPWALAGGVDTLCRLTYAGFHALKLLSHGPCRPFDRDRRGLSLGEGAAFFVLEPPERARARGATVLGHVRGWGLSSDGYHMTTPEPSGAGPARAILEALAQAALTPLDVGYINAHGTGTPANDSVEAQAFRAVFGDQVPPVSSTKGATGHTLGAAGALEAALALGALLTGRLPPSVGLVTPDPALALPHVPAGGVRSEARVALSTSLGFGGNNAALVLSRGKT